MILIDYNAIAIGQVVMNNIPIEEDMIRHVLLTQLALYHKRYTKAYGNTVICCDAGGNWRWDFYEHYKANRKTTREDDGRDWEEIFRIINLIREEIKDNIPWKVVQVHGCEGDDVIATLVDTTQEFGSYEKVMIISADHDFKQLQRYDNVEQWSTITKKKVVEKHANKFLFEKLCKGDSGDGVPNVLSADDVLITEGVRQTPVRQTMIDKWAMCNGDDELKACMGEEVYRNFQRNKRMIDLRFTPESLKSEIINSYETQETTPNNKVMPYLMAKRCRKLLENVGDFF